MEIVRNEQSMFLLGLENGQDPGNDPSWDHENDSVSTQLTRVEDTSKGHDNDSSSDRENNSDSTQQTKADHTSEGHDNDSSSDRYNTSDSAQPTSADRTSKCHDNDSSSGRYNTSDSAQPTSADHTSKGHDNDSSSGRYNTSDSAQPASADHTSKGHDNDSSSDRENTRHHYSRSSTTMTIDDDVSTRRWSDTETALDETCTEHDLLWIPSTSVSDADSHSGDVAKEESSAGRPSTQNHEDINMEIMDIVMEIASDVAGDDLNVNSVSFVTSVNPVEHSSSSDPSDGVAENSISDVTSNDLARDSAASGMEPGDPERDECKHRQSRRRLQQACSASIDTGLVPVKNSKDERSPELPNKDEENNEEEEEPVREMIRLTQAYRLFLPPDDDETTSVDDDDDEEVDDSSSEYSLGECAICAKDTIVSIRTCCQLAVCESCLVFYLTTKVNQGVVHIRCPGPHCDTPIPEYLILSTLHQPDIKKKFVKFLVEANSDPRVKTCPRCSLEYKVGDTASRGLKVTCSACHLDWCFPCHAPWHEGETCKSWRKRGARELRQWTKQRDGNNAWQVNAHKCPGCKTYISRSEGCPHMACSQCGTQFCYTCGKKFSRSRVHRHQAFRFLLGTHESRLSPIGCAGNFLPHANVRRKLIRGSYFGGLVVAGVVLTGPVLVCALAASLGLGVYAAVKGGARLTKRLRERVQGVVRQSELPRPAETHSVAGTFIQRLPV